MPHAPPEIAAADLEPARFQQEIVYACRPGVLRGLTAGWPIVKAALESPRAFKEYVAPLDAGERVEVFIGHPSIRGKYYYNAGLRGFNFERRMMKLMDALDCILEAIDHPDERSVYVGSVPTSTCLPGFVAGNPT